VPFPAIICPAAPEECTSLIFVPAVEDSRLAFQTAPSPHVLRPDIRMERMWACVPCASVKTEWCDHCANPIRKVTGPMLVLCHFHSYYNSCGKYLKHIEEIVFEVTSRALRRGLTAEEMTNIVKAVQDRISFLQFLDESAEMMSQTCKESIVHGLEVGAVGDGRIQST
jgi:hypothetical protein